MKKLALVLLTVVCCISFIGSIYAAELAKGETVYARSNLRAEGNVVVWHNMKSEKTLILAGTELKIVSSGGERTMFTMVGSNKQFALKADAKQWDKFFVKDRNEIGLDKFSPDVKAKVMNCDVDKGMTKEEVYVSKGCPAYWAWGNKTERSSLNEIMRSDKWYYMTSSRGHDVMVTFANGVVVKTGAFEK